MDYEKRFKDVLNKFAYLLESTDLIKDELREDIEHIFPELAESEDDRIRKAILELVRQSSEILEKKNQEQMIAWLEKQGKNNMGISEATKKKLEDNLNKALEKETPESLNKFLDEQGEQKSADKVEPKFKIGDKVHLINGSSPNYEDDCIVISDISNNTYYGNWEGGYFAIKDQDKYELVEQKPAWSEEDEAIYYGVIETEQYMLDVVNGIKKFAVGNISIKEECARELNWLKLLKERVQPQPKQEWTMQDEEELQIALDTLVKAGQHSSAKWLKNVCLVPQSTWKPSKEMLEALYKAIPENVKEISEREMLLNELYKDLKKLREE